MGSLFLSLAPAPAAGQGTAGSEVKRLRVRVEALMAETRAKRTQAGDLRLEAAKDREKIRGLRQQLAAIQARAEEARKKLQTEIQAAQSAEAALATEAARSQQLAGIRREAWQALRKNRPPDPRAAVLAMALERESIITEVLARKLAGPQQQAVQAYQSLLNRASEPLPPAPLMSLGQDTRATVAKGLEPDPVDRLDALARSVLDVTTCSAVETPSVDLPPRLARVAATSRIRAAATRLGKKLRAVLLEHQRALETRARTTSGRQFRAALGSKALAEAAANAAVAAGWRKAAWQAATTALAGFAAPREASGPSSPYPKVTRKLLEKLEKERGFGCEPSEVGR